MSSPSVVQYSYERLGSSSTIRVFDLLPGTTSCPVSGILRQVDLPEDSEAAPEYTAVSYTWGPPEDVCSSPIWIDGKAFTVRNNLFSVLRTLRHSKDVRTFWIDAIAINQKDVIEKNHQVGLMAQIYRTAETVKVWLGPHANRSEDAIEYIRTSLETNPGGIVLANNKSITKGGMLPPPLDAVISLVQRNYFSRAWIVQEVILAREIDVHCDTAVVAWDSLANACLALEKYLPDCPALHLMKQRKAVLNNEQPLHNRTLESLVRRHNQCECTDRRDRVFALLSLASDCAFGQGLQADYRWPRLKLLVQMVEFCRPDDPIQFISLLFSAFGKPSGDEHWHKMASKWTEACETDHVLEATALRPSHQYKVRVSHFVTVQTTLHDWARHYSVDALLDTESTGADTASHAVSPPAFIRQRSSIGRSKLYDDVVCRIDDSNMMVLLTEAHFVIFSTSQLSPVANPCTVLGLHENSSSCTWSGCEKL
jgi:hypothetical protein